MPLITRHQMGSALVDALRSEGLGVRDLFEGRQEPLSWFFRGVAYDQSELDILESGAVETLHAPSALVELAVDEMALALANVGIGGVASYLRPRETGGADQEQAGDAVDEGRGPDPADLELDPAAMLGVLSVDVAPPALWLEEREAEPRANEKLAERLSTVAERVGGEADTVEVHIEGALSAEEGWATAPDRVQPSGVSIHFTFDLPMVGADERSLARDFGAAARTASSALEWLREVFREE